MTFDDRVRALELLGLQRPPDALSRDRGAPQRVLFAAAVHDVRRIEVRRRRATTFSTVWSHASWRDGVPSAPIAGTCTTCIASSPLRRHRPGRQSESPPHESRADRAQADAARLCARPTGRGLVRDRTRQGGPLHDAIGPPRRGPPAAGLSRQAPRTRPYHAVLHPQAPDSACPEHRRKCRSRFW